MERREKIYEILKALSGAEEIGDSDSLQGDLLLDSLAMVTLLIDIEEALHIRLDESDMNPFDLVTAGDAVRLAEKYGGEDDE